LIDEYELNEGLCFVNGRDPGPAPEEQAPDYNVKVAGAINALREQLPTFLLKDGAGEDANYFLVEKGKFIGMGKLDLPGDSIDSIRSQLTVYPDSDYVRGLLYQFAEKYPEQKIKILSQP